MKSTTCLHTTPKLQEGIMLQNIRIEEALKSGNDDMGILVKTNINWSNVFLPERFRSLIQLGHPDIAKQIKFYEE